MTNDNKMNAHKMVTKSLICMLSFCHHLCSHFWKHFYHVIIFFLCLMKTWHTSSFNKFVTISSVSLDYISPGATYQKLSLNIAHDNQTRSSRIVNDIFLYVPCMLNVFVECSLWTLTLEGIFLLLEKANSLNYHPREGVQMGQSHPADDAPSTQPR